MLRGDALGGQSFWAATAEVRFPIPLIPDELGMSAAVFADAGSLFGASAFTKDTSKVGTCGVNTVVNGITRPGVCLADSDAIRTSVGAGILWNSPVGPLRLDYAHALSKETFDKTQMIRFGASTKF